MTNWIIKHLFPATQAALDKANERINELHREIGRHASECDRLRRERDRDEVIAAIANKALDEQKRRRNVAWPKPAKRIPRPVLLAAFAEPVDQGLPAALHQEIDDYLQDLLDQVSQPPSATMPETMRTHLAGGVEHVRLLQKHLLDLHDEASRKDAELEEKEGGGVVLRCKV
jgi:hypothetical protein